MNKLDVALSTGAPTTHAPCMPITHSTFCARAYRHKTVKRTRGPWPARQLRRAGSNAGLAGSRGAPTRPGVSARGRAMRPTPCAGSPITRRRAASPSGAGGVCRAAAFEGLSCVRLRLPRRGLARRAGGVPATAYAALKPSRTAASTCMHANTPTRSSFVSQRRPRRRWGYAHHPATPCARVAPSPPHTLPPRAAAAAALLRTDHSHRLALLAAAAHSHLRVGRRIVHLAA